MTQWVGGGVLCLEGGVAHGNGAVKAEHSRRRGILF